jgi:aspartate racemase
MIQTSTSKRHRRWRRTLGIVGGLGPHAHIAFESRLLASTRGAGRDQDYPPWIVSSLPATPDRTRALLGQGPSPEPYLVRSLRNLEGRADFALIACQTAHAFIEQIRAQTTLPLLELVRETILHLDQTTPDDALIGWLATTGSLQANLYPNAAAALSPRLRWMSLLDLPGGTALQRELVMTPIYEGIKTGRDRDPRTGICHASLLASATDRLLAAGCRAVVLGCTEISIAFADGDGDGDGTDRPRLVDPLQIAADRCLDIASGDAPLPGTLDDPRDERDRTLPAA